MVAFDPERAPQMCGRGVIGSKTLIHFVGRSFWQIASDLSFAGYPLCGLAVCRYKQPI
jgi:hypothetical protein